MNAEPVPLRTVAREWGRIGVTGFGGPPAHIALFRALCVDDRMWLTADEFEAALATCNLLPGPASTQLSMFCAYRVGGRRGVIVGGLAFIVPAVVAVIALSALFLADSPPRAVRGLGGGAGAAVAAVAVWAGLTLVRPSWSRSAAAGRGRRGRWCVWLGAGFVVSALASRYVVLALLGCGLAELAVGSAPAARVARADATAVVLPFALAAAGAVGGLGALLWVAFKVGALSYGGGFVIIPLMQADAVHTYHWMSSARFLDAVAVGQVTPGPVVATVAALGYAARGVGGAVLAASVAFAPSFVAVLLGAGRFEAIRRSARAQAFLGGSGPAAIGAILGTAIPLAGALHEWWQFVVCGAAAFALIIARRGVVQTLAGAAAVGLLAALLGAPLA